jgi:hypothetical protein
LFEALVRAEEEELVLFDGRAEGGSVGVLEDLGRRILKTARQLGLLVKPVIRGDSGVAVILVGAAVEGVGTAAGDERYLRAGGAA